MPSNAGCSWHSTSASPNAALVRSPGLCEDRPPWVSPWGPRVDAAAEELLKWPNRGPRWRLAAEACLSAMDGKMPTNEFRLLFEDAAQEEEMLLPD
ncbi:DUF982 domain-containing protein [Mesorhizobium opportunistum]|uniref:DUF982 domain-containing protein n=1 Tax=Mesorhizobium opportunistum TaxID=593909 RepID=UPI001FD883BD|nr:DUF982 domain-containing protein [Mesorhizobium opportunistum]